MTALRCSDNYFSAATVVCRVRTYISPIGFDTRRVTRPVVSTGIDRDDEIVLLRPGEESDTDLAVQAVAEFEDLLQEIEPNATCTVSRISTTSFESTVRDCCEIIETREGHDELIVSLGGGPRDILLPLTVATLVYVRAVDHTVFVSDIDEEVHEWTLPDLTTRIPSRTGPTFDALVEGEGWQTLSEIVRETEQSKPTVIRHVNDLEQAGVVESDTSQKAKRVRIGFSGDLRAFSRAAVE